MTSYTNNEAVNLLIKKYCANPDIHSGLFVNFKQLFDRVYDRIINPDKYQSVWCDGIRPDTDDMLERLKQEMIESNGMCYTGYITRIVNCLVGFYSDVRIGVSSSDQISAKITMILEKMSAATSAEKTAAIRESLREIDVEEAVINEWISNIPELNSEAGPSSPPE
jgi:hypothetical protein